MIIAIDGPAGSGKSTTARLVARKLGILHLDTGAMYRAITLKGIRENIPFSDAQRLGILCQNTRIQFTVENSGQHVWMDGTEVSDPIRSPEVTAQVSDYCAVAIVRELLVEQQRRIGNEQPSVIEGRDIGTVVFPHAEFKFFLIADVRERARRRQKEFLEKGISKTLDELAAEIELRDRKDSTREISPLRQASDAVVLDTTFLSIEDQVSAIVRRVQESRT